MATIESPQAPNPTRPPSVASPANSDASTTGALADGGASSSAAQSPPPNCAICLGNCVNKCYSDSCMHQFCFKCLLEWSKVKAECPLCKQPFKSIIHNVQENNKFDEHIVQNDNDNSATEDFLEMSRLPFYMPSSSRFNFRTRFTVGSPYLLAIDHLLSQPLSPHNSHHSVEFQLPSRRRRDVSSSHYRRTIYRYNLWAHSTHADITGRFRIVSPAYFQENPAATNRLVPWLNRELNVLLNENTQHVMYVVDLILRNLSLHHIQSRYFKEILERYLGEKTDHFIHEFYCYMRSPYDMIAYDTIVHYRRGPPPQVMIQVNEDEDSDSDVAVVSVNETPALTIQTMSADNVIEIDSDESRESDVILRTPTPPVVVDLVDSSDDATQDQPQENQNAEENQEPNLPIKIRLKYKRQRERRKYSKKRADKRRRTPSSDSSSGDEWSRRSKRHKPRKRHYVIKKETAPAAVAQEHDSSESDENESLECWRQRLYRLKQQQDELNEEKPTTSSSIWQPQNSAPAYRPLDLSVPSTSHSGYYSFPPHISPAESVSSLSSSSSSNTSSSSSSSASSSQRNQGESGNIDYSTQPDEQNSQYYMNGNDYNW